MNKTKYFSGLTLFFLGYAFAAPTTFNAVPDSATADGGNVMGKFCAINNTALSADTLASVQLRRVDKGIPKEYTEPQKKGWTISPTASSNETTSAGDKSKYCNSVQFTNLENTMGMKAGGVYTIELFIDTTVPESNKADNRKQFKVSF